MAGPNPDGSIPGGYQGGSGVQGSAGNSSTFFSDALGAVPVVGNILSGIIQRGQRQRDIRELREYNLPINQKQRLVDAGIPMAAMFTSGASNESQLPDSTNVDPALGAAEGITNYFQNRLTKQQIKLADLELKSKDIDILRNKEGLRKDKAAADIEEYDALDRKGEVSFKLGQNDVDPSVSNQVYTMKSQQRQQIAKEITDANNANLSGLNESILRQLREANIPFETAQGKLDEIKANISTQEARQIVMSQEVQESISRIAVNAQEILNKRQQILQSRQEVRNKEQAYLNMGQQYSVNEIQDILNQAMIEAIENGDGMKMMWIGAAKKLTGGSLRIDK